MAAGLIILYSLREIRKDTVAQAFSTVTSILYDEKVRMARRTLIGNSESDFTKWTQKEIDDAEIACFNYDIVGIMVRNKIVDQKLVIKEWRDSLIKSYEHAQPMITTYRKSNGNDFWDDFQWLYDRAKETKTS